MPQRRASSFGPTSLRVRSRFARGAPGGSHQCAAAPRTEQSHVQGGMKPCRAAWLRNPDQLRRAAQHGKQS
jgi:hypothetical protein